MNTIRKALLIFLSNLGYNVTVLLQFCTLKLNISRVIFLNHHYTNYWSPINLWCFYISNQAKLLRLASKTIHKITDYIFTTRQPLDQLSIYTKSFILLLKTGISHSYFYTRISYTLCLTHSSHTVPHANRISFLC